MGKRDFSSCLLGSFMYSGNMSVFYNDRYTSGGAWYHGTVLVFRTTTPFWAKTISSNLKISPGQEGNGKTSLPSYIVLTNRDV